MNKANSVLVRLDMTLMFIDLKVLLLVVFMFDFYRQTSLAADLVGSKRGLYSDILRWSWTQIGSPYMKWIPLAIIGDFFLKKIIRGLTYD